MIYKIIGSGDFPRPVLLTTRSVGLIESEVSAWIQSKIEERETG
ncbi:helix-turn-helix transcriptional regulator [Pseudomonas putida]